MTKKSSTLKKKKTARKSTRRRIVYSKCRALVPLDTEKIRKSEQKKLKRQKANCAVLDAELAKFEKEEVQAHQQWIQTHCGAGITEYRTIHAEISLLESTLELSFDLIDFYPDRTQKECADVATVYFETNGAVPEGYEAFFCPSFERAESASNPLGDDDDLMDEFEESMHDFEAFLEEMLNGKASHCDENHAHRKVCHRKQKAIKEVYRRIVRRLHPDGAGSTTPDRMELWHSAQAAYQNHDLETLQRIGARCDLLESDQPRATPVSSIQTGIAYYKKACAQFRSAIRKAKRLPEWGFLSWSEKKKQRVLKEHLRELAAEVKYLNRQRNDFKNQMKKLRTPPGALKRTPSKKYVPTKKPEPQNDGQIQFDFF